MSQERKIASARFGSGEVFVATCSPLTALPWPKDVGEAPELDFRIGCKLQGKQFWLADFKELACLGAQLGINVTAEIEGDCTNYAELVSCVLFRMPYAVVGGSSGRNTNQAFDSLTHRTKINVRDFLPKIVDSRLSFLSVVVELRKLPTNVWKLYRVNVTLPSLECSTEVLAAWSRPNVR